MLLVSAGPLCLKIRLESTDIPAMRDAIVAVLAQLFHPGQEPRVDALLGYDAKQRAAAENDETEPLLRQGKGFVAFTLMGGGARLGLRYYADMVFIHLMPVELLRLYDEIIMVLDQGQQSQWRECQIDSGGQHRTPRSPRLHLV